MKPKTKKHPEKIRVEIGWGTLVIEGKRFKLQVQDGVVKYYGDMDRFQKAWGLYKQLREELPVKMYKLGDALRIGQETQEEVQEAQ